MNCQMSFSCLEADTFVFVCFSMRKKKEGNSPTPVNKANQNTFFLLSQNSDNLFVKSSKCSNSDCKFVNW